MKKVRFADIEHDVTPGTLLGIDFAQGAKVGRPVRVGVSLKERVPHPDTGQWVWAGEIVKCSQVLEHLYLGAMIRVTPDLDVMVRG